MSAALTLALDASTYLGTVAVLQGTTVRAEGEAAMRGRDEERLMPAVADTLARAGVGVEALDRVVCGGGPGSFTSLRIAGAIAKGIATARGIPLYAARSLDLIAAGAHPALGPGEYLCALDAMRGELYVAAVTVVAPGVVAPEDGVHLWSPERLAAEAAERGAIPIGPGRVLEGAPHARGVSALLPGILAAGPVDLGAWEPAYGRLAEAQVKWEASHGRPLAG